LNLISVLGHGILTGNLSLLCIFLLVGGSLGINGVLDEGFDDNRVSTAVGSLHSLANKGHNWPVVSIEDLLDNVWISGDHFLDSILHILTNGDGGSESKLLSNLGWHASVSIDDVLHHHLAVGNSDLVMMQKHEKVTELLVSELVLNHILEVNLLLLTVTVDVLVHPLVDSLGVDLESPDESGEELDTPWVLEDVLDIGDIHTKLVAESLLHFKWDFSEAAVHARDPIIGHKDLWKIWILEESVIRLLLLLSEGLCRTGVGIEASSLSIWLLAILEHLNVASELVLHSTLHILGSSHILDLNTLTLHLLSLY